MNRLLARILTLTITLTISWTTSESAGAAGKTVPGEKWQQKITVQMEGMTMPMGGGEICVPVGKASAELAKPDKSCKLTNVKQVGNKFSADMKCTGEDAMEGSIEQTVDGDHMTGRMKMKSSDGDMTMAVDARKLGSCQAVDVEDVIATAKAQGAAATTARNNAMADTCKNALADMKKDPQQTVVAAMMFAQAGAPCATKPANPEFCAAIQARAGFNGLASAESGMAGITARSLEACNLGQGKAGVEALRAKLVASAVTDGDTGFLIVNAPAKAKELARTQCVLKGEMWAGRTAKLDRFCDSNFAEEARRGK